MLLTLTAEAVDGRRYELAAGDTDDEATARVRAARVANFLARLGDPDQWPGGRVTVRDRAANRLVFVTRIVARKGVTRAR